MSSYTSMVGSSVIPSATSVISAKASEIPSKKKKIVSFQPKQGYLEAISKTLEPCDCLDTLLSLWVREPFDKELLDETEVYFSEENKIRRESWLASHGLQGLLQLQLSHLNSSQQKGKIRKITIYPLRLLPRHQSYNFQLHLGSQYWNGTKGLCTCSVGSQTLTVAVCGNVKIIREHQAREWETSLRSTPPWSLS